MTEIGARAAAAACGSCPYRRDAPSGLWAAEEYAKLPDYDNGIGDQLAAGALAAFFCHQRDGSVCAGWLGHRDPLDLLAVRIGLADGRLDRVCADYTSAVSLFETGAAAAAHGMTEHDDPGRRARGMAANLTRKGVVRG